MKQIDEYVNKIYRFANGDQKEINELKVEMKNHLLEAVEELKREGKTEEEAFQIAKNHFGEEQVLHSVVGELFKTQKRFANRVLYTAFGFIFLGIIGFFLLGLLEYQHYQNVEEIGNEILNNLENQSITNETKDGIITSVEDNMFIYGVKVSSKNSNSEFKFFDDSATNPLMQRFNTGISNKDSSWSVEMEISNFDLLAYGSLLCGLVVYWVLFTIWSIINTYHRKQLNAGWVIIFALLNVVGYLAYIGFEQYKTQQSN